MYQEKTSGKTDWGSFPAAASVLGLAALGVSKLVNSSKKNPITTCAVCGRKYSIAYFEDLPPVVYGTCPNPKCQAELVAEFRAP